jgi:hypothetical protein
VNRNFFVVHVGTGTVISADECVIVGVPDEMLESMSGDDYFDDSDVISLAEDNGKPVNLTDVTWGNSIAFSPQALREEAQEILDAGIYDEGESWHEAFTWCATQATDDDLKDVASYILDDDDLWTTYRTSVTEGVLQGLIWHKEKSDKA